MRDQLKSIIERIERLDEEIKDMNGDKSEVYKEAKANGFDSKALRRVIALRRMDPAQRQEEEAMVDLYLNALGSNSAGNNEDLSDL